MDNIKAEFRVVQLDGRRRVAVRIDALRKNCFRSLVAVALVKLAAVVLKCRTKTITGDKGVVSTATRDDLLIENEDLRDMLSSFGARSVMLDRVRVWSEIDHGPVLCDYDDGFRDAQKWVNKLIKRVE